MKKNATHFAFIFMLLVAIGTGFYFLPRMFADGNLIVSGYEQNTRVIIGEETRQPETVIGTDAYFSVRPGTNLRVLVARQGHHPWLKKIDVPDTKKVQIKPFLVPVRISGYLVEEDTQEHNRALKIFDNDFLPREGKPKKKNNTSIWVEGDNKTIFAKWEGAADSEPQHFCRQEEKDCQGMVKIFSFINEIRSADFYKDREDVILIATKTADETAGVFVLEIDNRPVQNFQPVYTGNNPSFSVLNEKTIYILDGQNILRADI